MCRWTSPGERFLKSLTTLSRTWQGGRVASLQPTTPTSRLCVRRVPRKPPSRRRLTIHPAHVERCLRSG
jgi:hypothetical protein